MVTLRNYTNTKLDLESAKIRLNLLMDKKEELYTRFFNTTSNIKDVVVDGGFINSDKMANYMAELTKINKNTGKSLEQEINDQLNTVRKLEYYLNKIEYTLKSLTGIEADLYKEIIINGTKITRAVSIVAEKYDKEERTIWRLYHSKMKEHINLLKKI